MLSGKMLKIIYEHRNLQYIYPVYILRLRKNSLIQFKFVYDLLIWGDHPNHLNYIIRIDLHIQTPLFKRLGGF